MSGAQLNVLAGCAYQLLQTLDAEDQHGNLVKSETSAPLEELNRYVVSAIVSWQVRISCYPVYLIKFSYLSRGMQIMIL
jgi:hypothetical protein